MKNETFSVIILSPDPCNQLRGETLVSIGHGISSLFLYSKDKKFVAWLVNKDKCFYSVAQNVFKKIVLRNSTNSYENTIVSGGIYKKVAKSFLFLDLIENKINNDDFIATINKNFDCHTIFLLIEEDDFYKFFNDMGNYRDYHMPDLIIQGYSKCEASLKKVIENKEALIILHPTSDETCHSNFIKLIYNERSNFKNYSRLNSYKYPIAIVSKSYHEKTEDGHEYFYNPTSKTYYLSMSLTTEINTLHDETRKLIEAIAFPIEVYFSYGSTEKSTALINSIKEAVKLFLPYVDSFHDKRIDNFNLPLESYEEKLKNSDIVILIINRKFLYSRFALREISGIFKLYNGIPGNLIYLIDSDARNLFDNSEESDKLYQHWKYQEKESREKIINLISEEAKLDEQAKLNDYILINERIHHIIGKMRDIYDHKTIEDHEKTKMSSILWAIYQYITNSNKFDLYNKAKDKDFERIIQTYTNAK